jgi:hypothetical protein
MPDEILIRDFRESDAPELSVPSLGARTKSKACRVFSAHNRLSGEVMGYTSLAINDSAGMLWHDKFPLYSGSALVFGSYVIPRFRGMGCYKALLAFAQQHVIDLSKELPVHAVIEQLNSPSLRAHLSSGFRIMRKNWLIKFRGRNFLSLYSNPFRSYYVPAHTDDF